MMQQPEAMEGTSVPIGSMKLALSDEARASLEAVRVAQESARARARRQTRQARIWFAVLVGAVASGVALGPRLARSRLGHARALTSLPAAPTTPGSAGPAAIPAAAEPAIPNPSGASAPALAPSGPSVTAQTPVAGPAGAPNAPGSSEGCEAASIRSAPWRLSPEACARAFEADPNNASLALAVAHAEHAHARLGEAAKWAKRALALDPNAAEAYVIIARAEADSGRDEDAREAYRRYLDLAPRGWHRGEARAALRRASSTPR